MNTQQASENIYVYIKLKFETFRQKIEVTLNL